MSIKRHIKTKEWLVNLLGLTDKDFKKFKKYPAVYVYEIYNGGDDKIEVRCFNKILPDNILKKEFSEDKINGQLVNNEVCEINLQEEKYV